MMTSLQDIRNEIEVARKIDKPVSLPELFTKIGMDDFWSKYFNTMPLDIVVSDILSNNDTELSYSGKTNFLNVGFPEMKIMFHAVGATIDITVDLPLPAEWKFSKSFPKLPPSIDLSTDQFECKTSYLDFLVISNPGFHISTSKTDAGDEGLSFTGDLSLKGPYDIISNLSDKPVLSLHGNIMLTGDHPDLSMKADVPLRKEFVFENPEIYFSDVAVDLYSLLEAKDLTPTTDKIPIRQEWFDFSAILHFNKDKFKADLSAMLVLGNADFIFLQGVFEEGHKLQIPSLTDLANFLGQNKLDDFLPAQLQGDTNVFLSEFDFSFGTTDFQINYAGFTLELNKTFTILEKDPTIVLRNIQAHFQVDDPLHACKISFYLTGEFDFGEDKDVQLIVKGSSDLVFYCRLKPGSKVDIDKIFHNFRQDDYLRNMNLRNIAVTQF